jgi:hypothetical protein
MALADLLGLHLVRCNFPEVLRFNLVLLATGVERELNHGQKCPEDPFRSRERTRARKLTSLLSSMSSRKYEWEEIGTGQE